MNLVIDGTEYDIDVAVVQRLAESDLRIADHAQTALDASDNQIDDVSSQSRRASV